MRVRGLCRGDDLRLAGAELAERDVLADRAAEQVHDLADIGDLPAQRAARYGGDVLAVDQDAPGIDVVEAQDQIEHRRLAAARGADQRGDLARAARRKLMPRSTGASATVGEVHVGEFEARRRQRERRAVVIVRLARRAVDDLVEHAHADQIVIEVDVEPRQALGRLVGEQERRHERNKLARRRARFDHAVAAVDRSPARP